MRRNILSISLICAMLTASVVIVSLSRRGKAETKHNHVAVQQHQHADPPGTINGANNPELIPDHIAWSVILGVIARQDTSEKKTKIRPYIRALRLGAKGGQGNQDATNAEDDMDKLLGVAGEYETERKALDASAGFPLPSSSSLSAQDITAKAESLKAQKEQLTNTKVAHLSQNLTP